MTMICRCGAKLPNADALAAHQKFIHDQKVDPDEVMREEGRDVPTPGRITRQRSEQEPVKTQAKTVGRLREKRKLPDDGVSGVPLKPRAKPGLRHGTHGIKRPIPPEKVHEVLGATRVLGIRVDDMTREQWLLHAVESMRPDFVTAGQPVGPVRISIGWPGGRSARLDPLGQCWAPGAVADGLPAIFITPSQDDPVQVLATTRHEMVHAAGQMHHRKGFRDLARAVGFDPRPGKDGVSSTYRTPELQAALEALYAELGPFPHASVNKGHNGGEGSKPEVQSTRMLKVLCEADGYTLRATKKWLSVAVPTCPLCDGEMEVEVRD